jgi:uncharacterized membrane protein YoaK (UPF0700 family)
MLDAITWLLHGHVFTTAMTGNTVLLGVALLSHNPQQAMRHFLSLTTFVCGIGFGWWLLHRFSAAARAHRIALLVQILALTAAGCAPPGFPSEPLIVLIAFTASVQIASFQRIENITYNTTFVTGNVRNLVEAAFDIRLPEKRVQRMQQIRVLLPVCVGFAVGVLIGALAAPRTNNHSFWLATLPLIAALLLLR